MAMFTSGETTGKIAFFKDEQKFRFARTSEGDVYISPKLVSDYEDSLVQGACVELSYVTGEKSLVATAVYAVKPPLSATAHEGEVKFYNAQKGFGFITHCSDFPERDIFIHASICSEAGLVLVEGMKLGFHAVEDGGKLRAIEIRQITSTSASKQKKSSSKKRASTAKTAHQQSAATATA